jgi:hypothetical protein
MCSQRTPSIAAVVPLSAILPVRTPSIAAVVLFSAILLVVHVLRVPPQETVNECEVWHLDRPGPWNKKTSIAIRLMAIKLFFSLSGGIRWCTVRFVPQPEPRLQQTSQWFLYETQITSSSLESSTTKCPVRRFSMIQHQMFTAGVCCRWVCMVTCGLANSIIGYAYTISSPVCLLVFLALQPIVFVFSESGSGL